ncbi:MAG: hypothetical protein C5B51_21375 [Terriglobia bacterium]|nr:MAG: hypothetical protein C5B51_21375 [Terriglobia bacterium]
MKPSRDASSWSRRKVIRTVAGAAALPLLATTAPPRRRVGIVGGGMAGVSMAWLLDGKRDIVLLEAAASLGGNIQSIPIQLDGYSFTVDMGAQYFNPGPYPTYFQLLFLLGLLRQTHSFPASITLQAAGEAMPRFVSPVLPGRVWPILAPWNRAGLQAFEVAFVAAKQREENNEDWNVTLQEWLPTLGLSQQQWEGMILPWAASLFSGDIDQARGMSARAAMIFVAKALPDNPTDPLLYYVLNPGMAEVLKQMIAQCSTVQVLTGAPVTQVSTDPQGGFNVRYGSGQSVHVDDIVFSASGPATLQLLAGIPGTSAQQTALAGIEFHDARLALHTDPIYAPANPDYWSFFNAAITGGFCEASMWLADVLAVPPPETAAKLWKSWITHRTQQPTQVLYQAQFRHMFPTPATLQSQNNLLAMQGQSSIWFAGGYTRPYDSQETALVSAIDIAKRMLGDSARTRALGR